MVLRLHFSDGLAIQDIILHQYAEHLCFQPHNNGMEKQSERGGAMVHKVSGVDSARRKQRLDATEGHVAPGHSVLVLAESPHHDVQVGSDQDKKK